MINAIVIFMFFKYLNAKFKVEAESKMLPNRYISIPLQVPGKFIFLFSISFYKFRIIFMTRKKNNFYLYTV